MNKTIISTMLLTLGICLGVLIQKQSNEVMIKQVRTFEPEPPLTIFNYIDTFCIKYGVNGQFVYDIGLNESGWWKPNDLDFVKRCENIKEESFGDLQVNKVIFEHYNLPLQDTANRLKLLEYGIIHLANLLERFDGDYYITRFVYGRGHWRSEETWTTMERHFMSAMNWDDYYEK